MKYSLYSLLILLCVLQSKADCQIDTLFADGLYDPYLEELAFSYGESDLLNTIEYYRNNPVDLNTGTIESLMKLPFMDYKTASAIIKHRIKFGRFFSSHELYSVANADKTIIKLTIPFFFINNSNGSSVSFGRPNSQRIEDNYHLHVYSGIVDYYNSTSGQTYYGSMIKQYNHLLFRYKDYQFGLITEKDAGEVSYIDFNSFNITAQNSENTSTFIAGDYIIEFGQGLVMGGNYRQLRAADINSMILYDRNIIPYLGTNENRFMRGMAFNLKQESFIVSSFISYKHFDAVFNDSAFTISSIPSGGYHRTQGELQSKGGGKEFLYGGRLDIIKDSLFSIGLLYTHSSFIPALKLKYMDNELSKTDIYSLAYRLLFKNLVFAGEIAAIKDRISANSSLSIFINDQIQFIVSYRNYHSSLLSFHSEPAGQNLSVQGSNTGISTGIKLKTFAGDISLYFEQHKFSPGLNTDKSQKIGNELMICYNKELLSNLEISLKHKVMENITESYFNSDFSPDKSNCSSMNIFLKLNNRIRLNSRFDYWASVKNISLNKDNGFSFYQDIKIKAGEMFFFSTRVTFYKTASNLTRIYEFENEMPGTTYNSILCGKGIKLYFLLQYSPLNALNFTVKYSQDNKNSSSAAKDDSEDITSRENCRIGLQVNVRI